MKIVPMTSEEAFDRGASLPWVFLRCYSHAFLGETPEQIDRNEVLEAFFFSEEEEIRIVRADGRLQAARLTEEGEYVEGSYQISNKQFGERLYIRRSISFDEDGQASFEEPRLCGWKGGE